MRRLFQILMLLLYLIGSGVTLYNVLPRCRKGGNIEFVVLLDQSASFEQHISVSIQSVVEATRALRPGDLLGVIGFGETVKTYFSGEIENQQVLNDWISELPELALESAMLTDLPKAIDEANRLFEQFGRSSSKPVQHRLLLILSDTQSVLENNQMAQMPYLISPVEVVVIGFRSNDNDLVTRRLLGENGTNDLIITQIDDVHHAVEAMKHAITQAHPFQIPKLVLVVGITLAGLAVWIMVIQAILFRLEAKSEQTLEISLQQYGQAETEQTFSLGDYDSITIGKGICNYPLACSSAATITRENNGFFICPAEEADIAIEGKRLNEKKPLTNGGILIFDGHLKVQTAW